MSYIGRNIENLASRTKLDSISTSATATFNLLLNSVAYVPSSAESLTVSLMVLYKHLKVLTQYQEVQSFLLVLYKIQML